MTDLEDFWEDLPTGAPPVDAILRGGRAGVARRSKLIRPLIAVAASAALIGAFVAGDVAGNWPGSGIGQPRSGPSPVAFQADLMPAQSCDQLLTSYRDRALGLVSAWGWGPSDPTAAQYALDSVTPLTQKRAAQTASATGTNVQETSVDEPDTVKTDGKLVVRLRGDALIVYDATGSTMVKRSTVNIPRIEDGEILLVGDTIVVIGADRVSPRDDLTGSRRGSRVVTVSVKQPSDPVIESTVTYSSRVLSAREHGSVIRLVLAAGLPALDFIQPKGKKVTKQQALEANRLAIQMSTIHDWLPSYDTGKGSKNLLDCSDVAIPPDSFGLDTVSVVGFKATSATTLHSIGLAGAATIAYESADHLFLADGPSTGRCGRLCLDSPVRTDSQQSNGTTHLYDFALDGVYASHVASGEVEGTIADRWSLDEAAGVLRVAVGPSSETGDFNSVVTFRRQGQELIEIGRVDHLGDNEELKGVRWFDDLAVVVTYREVDPLFTIDLSNPAKPRRVGKLKIPGYSDYLHPLGNDEMVGIGYEGDGAQIALFDIADLAHVKRTDVQHYPHAEAIATWEPRAFTWLPDHHTVLTVLRKDNRVKVAVLKINNGHLTSTLTNVEYGDDANQVRTFELSDGRVVLVTGENVRFFNLP
ncbi:MAG: beta-propeller domain-containing protein [Aeromicrobium sp.]